MREIIKSTIKNIHSEVPLASSLKKELIFGLACYKYFYNEGRLDNSDFRESFTEGPNDGGIDLIAVNENESSKNLVLIQSKYIKDFNCKDDIKDIFTKMAQTVHDFSTNRIGSYNDNLRRIYKEKYDDAKDDPNFNIELVLFLGLNKDKGYKDKIRKHLNKVEELKDFDLSIFYLNEIENQIEKLTQAKRFVEEGKVRIFKEHGMITNHDNGIFVNISALSLRNLYDRYKDNGLFEQNFRYFIKNKKIDDQINSSLRSKRDKFWFLNNGIIIGCKDFRPDGDNIKLYDFSIINGCQTTTIIGEYSGQNEDLDFPIPCKIVKPDKNDEVYFNIFISEIAEASNSQKPISDRDLKSNSPEQRKLQRAMQREEPKIFIEIKRGEGILKKRNIDNWSKIKNDKLGQLILSFNLQQPGTARSSKRKIFADKSVYNKIFHRCHDKKTIVDLLKLSNYLDEFVKNEDFDTLQSNVAKNGKLTIIGVVGFLIKYERNLLDIKKIDDENEWQIEIIKDNLDGNVFDPHMPDDFNNKLNSLFLDIIMELKTLFESRGSLETSVTNFFKTDKKYWHVILKRVKMGFLVDQYKYSQIKDKLSIFST